MRTRSLRAALLVAAALAILPGAARAQTSGLRLEPRSLYLTAGLDYGTHVIRCRGCSNRWDEGWSGTLRVGGVLHGGQVVGLEASAGSYDHGVRGFASIGPVVLLHPLAEGGWRNLVLAGSAHLLAVFDDGPGIGAGVSGAIGYDLPLGRSLAVTPSVSYRIGRAGGTTSQLARAGVAVTIP